MLRWPHGYRCGRSLGFLTLWASPTQACGPGGLSQNTLFWDIHCESSDLGHLTGGLCAGRSGLACQSMVPCGDRVSRTGKRNFLGRSVGWFTRQATPGASKLGHVSVAPISLEGAPEMAVVRWVLGHLAHARPGRASHHFTTS